MPLFSVIIPLYNKEKSVKSTIMSVLNQSYTDFEVLVVNDGSSDNSLNEAQSMIDSRITVIDKPNGGVSDARNTGVARANGEYVCFLDGDDLWDVDFLTTIKQLIDEYPAASCYTTAYSCVINGKVTNTFGVEERGIIEDFFKTVYNGPIMCSSTACIKREVFNKIGGFDVRIRRGEDYDLWARVARNVKIAADPLVKAWYRLDAENRAMYSVPNPDVLWLSFIPQDEVAKGSMSEKKYYRKCLHLQFLEYLLKGKVSYAVKIRDRNKIFLNPWTYWLSPTRIQFRQIKTKLGL